MSDNVTKFESRAFKVLGKTLPQKLCGHSQVEVNEQTQMIECNQCGVFISPYDYILKIAKNEISLRSNVKYLNSEATQLQGEITELKRQRTNLKSQVNRLKNK